WYLPAQPGTIESADGEIIGRHQGLMYYTLGQRHGIGIGGVFGAPGGTGDVAAEGPESNVLIVVRGSEHPLLLNESFRTGPLHWLAPPPTSRTLTCSVRARYRQADQACTLVWDERGGEVALHVPQRAITPGQFAVFYDGEICLGGAAIEQVASGVS